MELSEKDAKSLLAELFRYQKALRVIYNKSTEPSVIKVVEEAFWSNGEILNGTSGT